MGVLPQSAALGSPELLMELCGRFRPLICRVEPMLAANAFIVVVTAATGSRHICNELTGPSDAEQSPPGLELDTDILRALRCHTRLY